jgi:branched-chain amino acid transport system permease protein
MELLIQQLLNGLVKGSIYALIALGYTMVYGIVELINFAHGDIFMLGSFIALALLGLFGVIIDPKTNPAGWVGGGWLPTVGVLLAVLLLAMLLTGLIGVAVERIAYRPLRNAPRLAPLISAIGMSFILQNVGQIWHGPAAVNFPEVFPYGEIKITSNISIGWKDIFVIVVCVTLMIILQTFVQRTKLGKAMRATAQDYDTSKLMGINVNMTITLTFFIGALLAGAAGLIYGLSIHSSQFTIGYQAGLKAFTAAVLGGIGNIPGAMLGGFLIGLVESLSDQYVSTAWTPVVVFGILILILTLRPSGLLGQQVPERA